MKRLLLIRHGQASFGGPDYDALSERGHEQSRILGRALAARGFVADLIVRGQLRRHDETAAGLLEGLGTVPPTEVDAGWDEFDFQHVIEVHRPEYRDPALAKADLARAENPRRAFQQVFEQATQRWDSGEHDRDYRESFPAFTTRVNQALARAADNVNADRVLVVSSGGPIGLVVSRLLAGNASLWARLNKVTVNTSVTKVLNGSSGLTLSVFNSHEHLEHDPALITYR